MQRLVRYLLASTALVPLSIGAVIANPLDPVMQAGSVTVTGEGTGNLNVLQSTDKAIIDWRTFNIGLGESTVFVQPDARSVVLNRVVGGEGASYILGRLSANGQVFLINPDGILFGTTASVDVGSLVATTHDLLNEDFLDGNYDFYKSGSAGSSIVNLGTITVSEGGFAALVAPGVRNAGVIRASLGEVGLASADSFALDFYGDGLIQLAVDDTTAGEVIDLETGETLKDLVSNSGLLSADGGLVSLTASAARAVVDSVINNTGNIEADSIGSRNGKIVLGAATADVKPADLPAQRVSVSGKLSATGDDAGETGGLVQITGEVIELTLATIDAFGWNGGGRALIGGDYMGGNGDPTVVEQYDIALESAPIPTASYLVADEGTSISADALRTGDGGKVILWSNDATLTAATLSARGGAEAGDGGFIETSGKYLEVQKAADASALNGEAGTWLLDPLNVHLKAGVAGNWSSYAATIFSDIDVDGTHYNTVSGTVYEPTGTGSYIDTNLLSAALNAGNNVYVTTGGTVGAEAGNIYVESDIRRTSGSATRFLTLDSANDIIFSSGVDLVSSTGKMHTFLWAHEGKISAPSMGQIDTNGGVFKIDVSDGVVLHSDYNMPEIFGLEIFAQNGAPRRDVDIKFDGDIIKFYYQNGVARVPSNGIQLVDSSDGYFELIAHNMDWVFYDRAIRVASHKPTPGVQLDFGFNYGADPTADLNGIAEIIWSNPFGFPIAAEPPSGQAVPVLELSKDGDDKTDEYAPTSLNGKKLLAQFLAGKVPQVITSPQPTPQVAGVTISAPTSVGAPTSVRTTDSYQVLNQHSESIFANVQLSDLVKIVNGVLVYSIDRRYIPAAYVIAVEAQFAETGSFTDQTINLGELLDTYAGGYKEVNVIACLATVYLMIERTVGDPNAVIDLDGWRFGSGATVDASYSFTQAGADRIDIKGNNTRALSILLHEMGQGLPVIVRLSDANTHFVLVTGYDVDANGKVTANVLDPFEGGNGSIDMSTLSYSGPTSEKFVAIEMRTIDLE